MFQAAGGWELRASLRPKASVLVFNALSDASTPSSPVANASSASAPGSTSGVLHAPIMTL